MASNCVVLSCLVAVVCLATCSWGENCEEEQKSLESKCRTDGVGCRMVWCVEDDYFAIQCVGSVCHCVTVDGTKIGDYSFEIGLIRQESCLCARNDFDGTNATACDATGSYEPVLSS